MSSKVDASATKPGRVRGQWNKILYFRRQNLVSIPGFKADLSYRWYVTAAKADTGTGQVGTGHVDAAARQKTKPFLKTRPDDAIRQEEMTWNEFSFRIRQGQLEVTLEDLTRAFRGRTTTVTEASN